MNVVRDRALLMLRHNNEVVLNKQLEVTVTRFAGGDVSQTDIEQARARVARARAETLEAEANLALSEARFQQFVGRGMDEKVAIPALAEDLPATLDDAIKLALQHNPELEELANLHRAAQNTVDVRYSALLPQVSFSASSRYEDDPVPGDKRYSRLDSIGVNLRVPIFEGGIERARVRKARHQVDQRQYELDERRRDVRQRVITQWNEYQAAREAIGSREIQVRAAKVARDGVTKEAQAGERSVFDILEAEQELLDAEVSLVTAQRNAIVREYTLKATLGMLTAQQLALNSDGIYSPEEHFRDSKHQFFSTRIRAE
jgi:outer membrane protein